MIKELKKIRKSLSKKEEVVRNLQPSSVFYKGMDLVTLGRNNLEPSRYGAKLGRALFSDEELCEGMLFYEFVVLTNFCSVSTSTVVGPIRYIE